MKITKRNIKKHLFICCNQKSEGYDCCADKGASQLVTSLKMRLREEGFWDEVRVTSSGCLGPCGEGISGVLCPDNILLTNLSLSSEEELFNLLTK